MINIGATFVYSVLTFYTFYRYILQRNSYHERLTRQHFNYQIFYLIYTNMVIYAGSILAREVGINQIVHFDLSHLNAATFYRAKKHRKYCIILLIVAMTKT